MCLPLFFSRKMTAEGAPIETPPKVVTTTPPVASSEHSIEELQSSPVGSQNPITYQRPRIINITQVAAFKGLSGLNTIYKKIPEYIRLFFTDFR